MTIDNNPVIEKVVDLFAPGSLALAVTGSFARGTNTPYSDLDIIRYIPSEMLSCIEPYKLHIIDEQLVSLTHTTFDKVAADLNLPRLFFFCQTIPAAVCYPV